MGSSRELAVRPIAVRYDWTYLDWMELIDEYYWTNPDVYPERNDWQIIDGEKDLGAVLLHLDREITSFEALGEMEQINLRSAVFAEALAFGDQYPKLQLEFPIVCLGSQLFVDGAPHCPILDRIRWERTLTTDLFNDPWDQDCRFLAIVSSRN